MNSIKHFLNKKIATRLYKQSFDKLHADAQTIDKSDKAACEAISSDFLARNSAIREKYGIYVTQCF